MIGVLTNAFFLTASRLRFVADRRGRAGAESLDLLRSIVFNYCEILCCQIANRAPMFIGDCHIERYQIDADAYLLVRSLAGGTDWRGYRED
jgi:hypothetical protein